MKIPLLLIALVMLGGGGILFALRRQAGAFVTGFGVYTMVLTLVDTLGASNMALVTALIYISVYGVAAIGGLIALAIPREGGDGLDGFLIALSAVLSLAAIVMMRPEVLGAPTLLFGLFLAIVLAIRTRDALRLFAGQHRPVRQSAMARPVAARRPMAVRRRTAA